MLIGAHVSAAGGVSKAVQRGLDIGAECIQIFVSSPRAWAIKIPAEEEAAKFREEHSKAKMGPTAVHGKYLLGLGSPDDQLVERSIKALATDLSAASVIGALGVVFHPASHKGRGFEDSLPHFCDAVTRVLAESPDDVLLMLETSAGAGDHIGSKFEELGRILDKVNDDRLAVCLDTQHVWAAGYDISQPETLKQTMKKFNDTIGFDKLKVVHANDSKRPLASAVDRHENIGHGEIGRDGFLNLLSHSAFKDLPLYLEVPGMEGNGPDRPNVDALKSIRDELGVPAQ